MKNFQRILSMILALCLVITMVPVQTFAEESAKDPITETAAISEAATNPAVGAMVIKETVVTEPTESCFAVETGNLSENQTSTDIAVAEEVYDGGTCGDNLTWSLVGNTLTISGSGPMNINYSPRPWTDYYSIVESIVISAGVTSISDYAFSTFHSLTSISLPCSLSSIGKNAFYECEALTCITFPDSLTSIGDTAFSMCKNLESISIPNNVTYIGDGAFCGCTKLTSITLPDSLCRIGVETFRWCSSLTSVILPNSLISIGDYAFYGCDSLTDLTIPDGVTYIGVDAFFACKNLKSVKLHDSLYSIERRAFARCTSLTDISIPGSLTNIGDGAFQFCSSLENINIPCSVSSFGDEVFFECNNLKKVTFPDSLTCIGNKTFYKCSSLTSVVLPDSLTSIGESAFYGCSSLINIIIPDGVVDIGSRAFYDCSSLISITLPNNLSVIKYYLFGLCSSLTEIILPDSLTFIAEDAFYKCSSLTSITIPENVTSFDYSPFNYCSSLKSVFFVGNAPLFGYETFRGVTATAYYPSGNNTWTNDIMQDYGGTITWVAYDPSEGFPDGEETAACPLSKLTDVDYLAFSAIAYLPHTEGMSVEESLIDQGKWEETWSSSQNITYQELCANIAQWKIATEYDRSSYNGFYAVPFINDHNEFVIAYRGSVPPDHWGSSSWDAYCDWLLNDLPMELGNTMGPQIADAFSIYNTIEQSGVSEIAVTGHSLGGAWATSISAYSGCKAVTFNSVSILDVLYKEQPLLMSRLFEGVDRWNFVDHTNQYDVLAGMFENYLSTRMKPYVAHKSNIPIRLDSISAVVGAVVGFISGGPVAAVIGSVTAEVGRDIAACHAMETFVTKKDDGTVALTPVDSVFEPRSVITNYMTTVNHSVDFGATDDDKVKKAGTIFVPRSSYGGNGADLLISSLQSDTLAGGKGDDELDGRWGNDTYIYHKGDGFDVITDVAGIDTLQLVGFSEADNVIVVDDQGTGYIFIVCNSTVIIKIRNKSRHKKKNTFLIDVVGITQKDISAYFSDVNYGGHVLVGCPVDIQILDTEGNVVYTLEDGKAGNYYTDYGNFYVFEEEDGGYGKTLDLVEGYTVKIVGVDTGTMDITYHPVIDGKLGEPKTLTEIPVTAEYEAILMESETGEIRLHDTHTASTDWFFDEANHWHSCTGCTEILNYSPHSGGTATCAEKAVCTVCGAAYKETDAANHTGETEIRNAREATETEEGYTGDTYCTGCNKLLTSGATIPVNHVHTEEILPGKEATCTQEGLTKGQKCTACGKILIVQETIPLLDHRYDDNVDGTCNACGIHREEVESRKVVHMFRMYNPNTGEHFYTGSEEERDNLIGHGWQYEGVGFTFPANTGDPVHRLFEPATGEHLYTMDEEEKAALEAAGWNYEGIAFNSAYDTEAVQHRLHNPNATVGAYHFTFSLEEKKNLIDAGWEYQGIGWYSCWK